MKRIINLIYFQFSVFLGFFWPFDFFFPLLGFSLLRYSLLVTSLLCLVTPLFGACSLLKTLKNSNVFTMKLGLNLGLSHYNCLVLWSVSSHAVLLIPLIDMGKICINHFFNFLWCTRLSAKPVCKQKNITLTPTPFRSTKMFKLVEIFVSFGTKIPTFLNISVLLKGIGLSAIFLALRFSIMPALIFNLK